MTAPLASRGCDRCAKCQRRFEPCDRVTQVYIVEKVTANPNNLRQLGAWMIDDFEMVHVDCANPSLDRGGIVVSAT